MKLTHYLSVQRSKRVFWHDNYGVMRSDDMLGQRTVDKFNLEPLLVLGIMYGHLPASVIHYCRAGSPVCLSELLLQFWTPDTKYDRCAISGMPELLVIDRRLRGALHASFFEWLEPLCEWCWSDELPNGKQFAAQTRCLQSYPYIFNRDSKEPLERLDVVELNKHQRPLYRQLGFSSAPPKQRSLLAELSGSARAVPAGLSGIGPDVDTTSQAFFCYSPQNDTELDAIYWRKGDLQEYGWLEASKSPENAFEDRENAWLQEDVATLMLMQVGASARLAKHFQLSISALRRKILSDRDLNSMFNCEVRSLLGIDIEQESSLAATSGLLLSIDAKFPMRKAESVWCELTCGGDYRSVEILPEVEFGKPEPDWCYIVILEYNTPILLRLAKPVASKFMGSIEVGQESPVFINMPLFHRLVDLFDHPDEPEGNNSIAEYLWPILMCDIESRSAAYRDQIF